ncbi:MAG: signal transduction histidine kinase [bacterium]|jgi:signal transduction histidine kinase
MKFTIPNQTSTNIISILIVGDQNTTSLFNHKLWKNFHVIFCSSVDDALSLAKKNQAKIIIYDSFSNQINGDFLETIFQQAPNVTHIFWKNYELSESLLDVVITRPLSYVFVSNNREELLYAIIVRSAEMRTLQEQMIVMKSLSDIKSTVPSFIHDLGTPLGIGITAMSHLSSSLQKLEIQVEQNQLKKSDLSKFIEDTTTSTKIVESNLQRAVELSQRFKSLTIDQVKEGKRKFDVASYIQEIIASLSPKIRHHQAHVELVIPENIEITSYPGNLYQVIANLVTNALVHAFDQKKGKRKIKIKIKIESEQVLELSFSDNGGGILEENLNLIYEPFFTTKPNSGGTGLGLNIIQSIVQNKLQGQIICHSVIGKGTTFIIRIPLNLED